MEYRRWCDHVKRDGELCKLPAGHRTSHPGQGWCRAHGGNRQRYVQAWAMAESIAAELDVSPWQALLLTVRRSAARAAYLTAKLSAAVSNHEGAEQIRELVDGDSGIPEALPRDLRGLLVEARKEDRHLATVARYAIDAGVAERLVRNVELESRLVVEALVAALDTLQLTSDQRVLALDVAHAKLISGEVVSEASVDGSTPPDDQEGE